MKLTILFFVSKIFDLFTTRLFLKKGLEESSIIYNKLGENMTFWLIYLLTPIVYLFIQKYKRNNTIMDLVIIYIAISFIVPLYNLAITFLI